MVALAGFGLAAACSLALSADDKQCESEQDCSDRGFVDAMCVDEVCVTRQGSGGGGGSDPKWGCLGDVVAPEAMPGTMVSYQQQVTELLTGQPPANAVVRLCGIFDVNCDTPVIDDVDYDTAGNVTFMVESGFAGYLEVRSDETIDGLVFFFGPIVEDTLVNEPISLVTQEVFDAIATTAGYTPIMDRGHALVLLTDCTGGPSEGVSITSDATDPDTVLFYLINSSPSETAPGSDTSGFSGVFNAVPGFLTITGTRTDNGELIGSTRAQIREGWMSYFAIVPGPAGT